MKKIVICAVLFAAMAAYSESGVNAMPKQTTVQTADSEDGWEYIGALRCYTDNGNKYYNFSAYVKVIGGYLFYRVLDTSKYSDGYYLTVAPNPNYNPNGTTFTSRCKYTAGKYYIKDIG